MFFLLPAGICVEKACYPSDSLIKTDAFWVFIFCDHFTYDLNNLNLNKINTLKTASTLQDDGQQAGILGVHIAVYLHNTL